MNIYPEDRSGLESWLRKAAEGISVFPDDGFNEWKVEVNNGLGGHAGEGSVIATCTNEQEAQLIAVALWALVKRENAEQMVDRFSDDELRVLLTGIFNQIREGLDDTSHLPPVEERVEQAITKRRENDGQA